MEGFFITKVALEGFGTAENLEVCFSIFFLRKYHDFFESRLGDVY